MAVSAIQYMAVTRNLYSKRNICPVCYEIRASLIQLFGGIIAPMCISPILSLFLTMTHVTEAVPRLQHPKEWFQFYLKLNKGQGGKGMALAALQIVVAVGAVSLQYNCVEKVLRKEKEIEKSASSDYVPGNPETVSRQGVLDRHILRTK